MMITIQDENISSKKEYENKVKDFVDEIDGEIMKAEMQYRDVSDEAKQQISQKMQELKEKRSRVETHYHNLLKSSEENWEEVKNDLTRMTDEVNAAVEGVMDGIEYAAKKMNG